MRFRFVVAVLMCAVLVCGASAPSVALGRQGSTGSAQSSGTPVQRLDIMRSRLDTMRRTLNGAIAGLNAKDSGAKDESLDDPRTRLRGLEKEVNSLISEISNLRGKIDRAEKYDSGELDKLETGVADLSERVDAGMRSTAGARAGGAAEVTVTPNKKKRGIFSRILGRGDDDRYAELVGTVAPGRDRVLFEEATREARKNNYEVARSLYNVIITTYPESVFLPLAKLAIADTFYLEGSSAALIQAAQSYQDWLTFFPTDPLADDVMLKIAEVEMRGMGLPDRETVHARKAEQRLKVLLQQFPNTVLRADAEIRLREVQENLAMHDMIVGDQYFKRYFRKVASNPKGAQSRYLDIVKKYPNFSYMDEVLYRLGVTYVEEEEPDEAAKYFQQIVRSYPNSKHAEKAREQLEAIGLAVPDADPKAKTAPPPERPSFKETLLINLLGTTPKTIDGNGILISSDDKARDLIQEAIEKGGQLEHTAPAVPTPRVAPARPLNTTSVPATKPATPAAGGVSVQPTQPGPPKSPNDPTMPQTNQPPNQPPASVPANPPAGAKPKP
ncbi:MAG TPA: outer membrane protein assembly factor BamD [Pyrinomonadaceae bacterium]|nr:outer membrane protein assembly factor BamD [Pyrinomonadaceae bacterium]